MKQLNHYETLEKMPDVQADCLLFACGISAENLGLILRSADIFGVSTIYYQGLNTINNKSLLKVSRNSNVQLNFVNDFEILLKLKQNGYEIVALEITDTSIPLRTVTFQQKICLIIGHEQNGVCDDILNFVDFACHIEMIGQHISSLNVSVATSIALYKIAEQCLSKFEKNGL
jgi:tRNA G18 (ribose-2'-O)-methylase SpoU